MFRRTLIFALASALMLAAPALAASRSTVRASGTIPIHDGPGARFDVIGKLPDGTRVRLSRCTSSGNWCRIIYPGGPDGWVRASSIVGMAAKVEVTPYRFHGFDPLDPIPGWPFGDKD
jgi:uncharacterized protein YraI